MKDSGAAMSVNCNVRVMALDRKGNVTQLLDKHNKATVIMVEGLLRFLQGHFNDTVYNKDKGGGIPDDATPYVPVKLSFGTVGVKSQEESDYGNKRMFLQVDSSEFVEPTFDATVLQDELPEMRTFIPLVRFSDMELAMFEDSNNSESLRIIAQVDPGTLVGRYEYDSTTGENKYLPYERSFFDPSTGRWTTMLTEIGLYSSSDNMLARVLLDGPVSRKECINNDGELIGFTYQLDEPGNPNNPLVQDEFTTIIVEWKIGLVSIGDNDKFVTQNSVALTKFINDLGDWVTIHVTPDSDGNYPPPLTDDEIKEYIRELLQDQGILSISNIDTNSI